jgi:hypothetical protein
MGISFFRMTSPVSTEGSKKKVVTPVSVSPCMMAWLMGAAPRYLGNKDPCRLKAPSVAVVKTLGGKIL